MVYTSTRTTRNSIYTSQAMEPLHDTPKRARFDDAVQTRGRRGIIALETMHRFVNAPSGQLEQQILSKRRMDNKHISLSNRTHRYELNTHKTLKKKYTAALRPIFCETQDNEGHISMLCQAGIYELIKRAALLYYTEIQSTISATDIEFWQDKRGNHTQTIIKSASLYSKRNDYTISLYHTTSKVLVNGGGISRFFTNDWPQIEEIIHEINSICQSTDPQTLNDSMKECLESALDVLGKPKMRKQKQKTVSGSGASVTGPLHLEVDMDRGPDGAARSSQAIMQGGTSSPAVSIGRRAPIIIDSNTKAQGECTGNQSATTPPGGTSSPVENDCHTGATSPDITGRKTELVVNTGNAMGMHIVNTQGSTSSLAESDNYRKDIQRSPLPVRGKTPQRDNSNRTTTKSPAASNPAEGDNSRMEIHRSPLTVSDKTPQRVNTHRTTIQPPIASQNHQMDGHLDQIPQDRATHYNEGTCHNCHVLQMKIHTAEVEMQTAQKRLKAQEKSLQQREKDLNIKVTQYSSARTHISALEAQVRQLLESNKLLTDQIASIQNGGTDATNSRPPMEPVTDSRNEDRLTLLEAQVRDLKIMQLENRLEQMSQSINQQNTEANRPRETPLQNFQQQAHPGQVHHPTWGQWYPGPPMHAHPAFFQGQHMLARQYPPLYHNIVPPAYPRHNPVPPANPRPQPRTNSTPNTEQSSSHSQPSHMPQQHPELSNQNTLSHAATRHCPAQQRKLQERSEEPAKLPFSTQPNTRQTQVMETGSEGQGSGRHTHGYQLEDMNQPGLDNEHPHNVRNSE